MLAAVHPAMRSLASRRGRVFFGDMSAGDPTPKSYQDIAIDQAVRKVLDFANRFAPPNKKYQTMKQVADHRLFGVAMPS